MRRRHLQDITSNAGPFERSGTSSTGLWTSHNINCCENPLNDDRGRHPHNKYRSSETFIKNGDNDFVTDPQNSNFVLLNLIRRGIQVFILSATKRQAIFYSRSVKFQWKAGLFIGRVRIGKGKDAIPFAEGQIRVINELFNLS